jgi:predicted RNase H-like HicB family nuclease
MVKISYENPHNRINVFHTYNGHNRSACIHIQHIPDRFQDNGDELIISPEEAKEMAKYLMEIYEELLLKNDLQYRFQDNGYELIISPEEAKEMAKYLMEIYEELLLKNDLQ